MGRPFLIGCGRSDGGGCGFLYFGRCGSGAMGWLLLVGCCELVSGCLGSVATGWLLLVGRCGLVALVRSRSVAVG